MSFKKVNGASEKVSPPVTQTFAKHVPSVPSKKKIKYSK